MATAIVTGASSGIGKAITLMLLEEGYQVIGISRTNGNIHHKKFYFVSCDLRFEKNISALKSTFTTYSDLSLLVNAAGFGRFEPHEELTPAAITDMISLNLTAPILLSNLLLRQLKATGGSIINITSIEATRASKFSALYTATKTGLRGFGQSLFEEVRNNGIGVITINPDMTDTPFFDDLRFGVGNDEDTRLFASDIADAIRNILSMREGINISELTIRPQRFGITKKR